MREILSKVVMVILIAAAFGCEAKATGGQINTMCMKKLELQGKLRGTVEADEVARVEEEYRVKEESLKKEMARDLKGMEDVRQQKLKDIENGQAPPLTEEETAAIIEKMIEADPSKKKIEELTPEQIKEEQTKKGEAVVAKRKKEITDQFERLLSKLGPQKKYAIRDVKKYVKKRKKEADESKKGCLEAAEKKGVTEKVATCRAQAKSKEDYSACK